MAEQKNKPLEFTSGISFGRGMDADGIRTIFATDPRGASRKFADLIKAGKFGFDQVEQGGGIRVLWDALANTPKVEMEVSRDGVRGLMMASTFPMLMSGMTAQWVTDKYNAVPRVSDQLVTERDTNKRITQIANMTNSDVDVDNVPEGEDYPLIGAGEEFLSILQKRNGRRLAITSDALRENDMSDFIGRLNALAEIFSYKTEYQSLERIQDIDGSASSPTEPYVLRPSGAGTPLYVTSNAIWSRLGSSGNRIVNNALEDESDLEEARLLLTAMTNSLGYRVDIPMSECQILVPAELGPTAWKIRNSIYASGIQNEKSSWGPEGTYQPQVLESAVLSRYSTTAWYLGNFRKQFQRVWKTRAVYATLGDTTESFLQSGIAFQASIQWSMEVGATDAVYVVQSLVSTSYPARP